MNESKVKQLQDFVCKNVRQKKYQRPQQKVAETDAINSVEEIPETHLKLSRNTSEKPTVKQRLKTNIIEERCKQQPTVRASHHRQVVIPNKVLPNKKITLKKPESSDRILAKITLSQQAICSSIDLIM